MEDSRITKWVAGISVGRMLRKGTTALLVLGLMLSIMLWAATYFFSIAVISEKSTTAWVFSKGCVGVDRNPMFFSNGGAVGQLGANAIYGFSTIHRFWKSRAFDGWETVWTPKLKLKPLRIVIPLWIPALLFLTLTCKRISPGWRRAWRRRRKSLCLKCGYNLTGNVSGVCPECGTAI